MPKTLKKNQYATSLNINSNTDEINTGMDRKTNFSENSSSNVLIDIKPTFSPTLTANDVIKNANKSKTSNKNRAKTFPNGFIAYRMALTKEYRNNNFKLPRMGNLSKIAQKSWEEESQEVKDFYNKLADDAKSLYNQNNIQIVFDKHMNEIENSQENGRLAKRGAESDYVNRDFEVLPFENSKLTQTSASDFHPIQDSTIDFNSSHYNNVIFPNRSSTYSSLVNSPLNNNISEVPYEMNTTLNDQEYIRLLEQTIIYLL
ncbi:10545_t:CDS:1 [Funneliformis geosporum]|uniref:10545_t:CDS:1 n=1 Tax=Funneliformis geosporum TaxID=1117311 RepID=A0A9W4WVA9_9GLOM|nr:10545_t:CDS:1 [Funneliformis geosporum]